MKRIASLAAVAIMATGSLSACGGDDYCDKLKEYKSDKALENADENTEEGQQQLLDTFEDLESSAPDELKDDYALLIDAFKAFIEGEQPEAADQAKLSGGIDQHHRGCREEV